jgi:hypothetical protein
MIILWWVWKWELSLVEFGNELGIKVCASESLIQSQPSNGGVMRCLQPNPAGETVKDSRSSQQRAEMKFLSPLPRFSWPLVPHCL